MASHQSLRQRFARAVPLTATRSILIAGLGGFGVIFLLAEVTARFEAGLLIAPFGASCVLVFGLPQSPLAQPRSVIGGHVVSTVMGLLVFSFLGSTALAFGLGVGLAIVTTPVLAPGEMDDLTVQPVFAHRTRRGDAELGEQRAAVGRAQAGADDGAVERLGQFPDPVPRPLRRHDGLG